MVYNVQYTITKMMFVRLLYGRKLVQVPCTHHRHQLEHRLFLSNVVGNPEIYDRTGTGDQIQDEECFPCLWNLHKPKRKNKYLSLSLFFFLSTFPYYFAKEFWQEFLCPPLPCSRMKILMN